MNPHFSRNICTGTEVPAKRVIPKITNYYGEELEDKRLVFEEGKQKELFSFLFKTFGISQNALAEELKLSRRAVRSYYSGMRQLKLSTFQKLLSICPEIKQFEKFIVQELPLNWGAIKGGKKTMSIIREKYGEEYLQMLRQKGAFGGPNNSYTNLKTIKIPQKISSEIAELAGAYLGDGNLTEYNIRIAGDKRFDKIYFTYISDIAERNFGIKGRITEIDSTNNLLLDFCSIKFTTYFRETFGFKNGDKIRNQSQIPQFILDDENLSKSFLRGLIDTDGSVGRRDDYLCLVFSSHNPPLLNQVYSLGLKFGYFSHRNNVQAGSNSWPIIQKYFAEVGSSNLRHIIRFEERRKNKKFLYQKETLDYYSKYKNLVMPHTVTN